MRKRLIFTTIPVMITAALLVLLAVMIRNKGEDKKDNNTNNNNAPISAEDLLLQRTPDAAPTENTQSQNVSDLLPQSGGDDDSPASKQGAHVFAWTDTDSGNRLISLQSGEMPQELFAFPGITTGRIQRCSHHYRSDKGELLFIGADRGDLVYYPFDGGDPITIGQTLRLTCAGPNTLQISSDGKKIAYLEFANSSLSGKYRSGNLIVYSLEQKQRLSVTDFVVDFQMSGDNILALRFYPDGEGRASEADLDMIGSSDTHTVAILTPRKPDETVDAECFFASGAIARAGKSAFVLTGEVCDPGGSPWRLTTVSLDNGSATETAFQQAGGGFYNEEFSTQVFPSTDGSAALVAVPSGLERHIVRLIWVKGDGTTDQVADYSIADRMGDVALEARHLLISPEGNWLAYIEVTPNGQQSLKLIDLSWPFQEAQAVMGLGANEQFKDMRWGPGGRLFTISGSDSSNAIFVTIPGMEPVRLARGQFTSLEPDSQGKVIAVSGWIKDPNSTTITYGQASLMDMNGNLLPLWNGTVNGDAVTILGVE